MERWGWRESHCHLPDFAFVLGTSPQLHAATLIDDLPTADVRRFESELMAYMHENHEDTLTDINQSQQLSDEAKATLDEAIEKFKSNFRASA